MKPKRVLFGIWFAISTVGTVISLASLTDDIIAWSSFIRSMIASYREITDFIWGNLFAVFKVDVPQVVHDYLTINSLFAVSVAWALFYSAETLGFQQLGSFWQFLKNNVGSFSVGDSYLANFAAAALTALREKPGLLTPQLQAAIAQLSSPQRTTRGTVEGIVSIVVSLLLFATASFLIPPLMRWLDVRHHREMMEFLDHRRKLIDAQPFDAEVRNILLKEYDVRYGAARDEMQITMLYHSELRKGLIWYLAAVSALFLIVVFTNNLVHSMNGSS